MGLAPSSLLFRSLRLHSVGKGRLPVFMLKAQHNRHWKRPSCTKADYASSVPKKTPRNVLYTGEGEHAGQRARHTGLSISSLTKRGPERSHAGTTCTLLQDPEASASSPWQPRCHCWLLGPLHSQRPPPKTMAVHNECRVPPGPQAWPPTMTHFPSLPHPLSPQQRRCGYRHKFSSS